MQQKGCWAGRQAQGESNAIGAFRHYTHVQLSKCGHRSAVWPALSHPAMLHLKALITPRTHLLAPHDEFAPTCALNITCSRERSHISTAATDSPDQRPANANAHDPRMGAVPEGTNCVAFALGLSLRPTPFLLHAPARVPLVPACLKS